MDFYLTAYQELQHDRQIGMTAGSIPWSSIVKWAELHGIHGADEISILVHHIRAMEKAVKDHDENAEEERNTK